MNFKLIYILIAAAILYFLLDFVIILFIAFLLTTGLLPMVRSLKRKKIPRTISTFILVLILLIIPISLVINIGGVIIKEGTELADNLPQIIDQVEASLNLNINDELQSRLTDNSERILSEVFNITGSIIGVITKIVILIVITAYWLIYYETTRKGLVKFIAPTENNREFIDKAMTRLEKRLGGWVKGQLVISSAVGLLTWLVLLVLGVPYAGVLALVAAFLEFIPTLGPILAAVPALLIASTIDLTMIISVLVAYIAIQQIESYLIAPKIIGKAVRISPFIILLSVIAGAQLLGLIGALIAVPAVITGQEIYLSYQKYKKEVKN